MLGHVQEFGSSPTSPCRHRYAQDPEQSGCHDRSRPDPRPSPHVPPALLLCPRRAVRSTFAHTRLELEARVASTGGRGGTEGEVARPEGDDR